MINRKGIFLVEDESIIAMNISRDWIDALSMTIKMEQNKNNFDFR